MIASLFPSASEMELDYWTASEDVTDSRARSRCRMIRAKDNKIIAVVPRLRDNSDEDRDVRARRIEMLGEIYEELRQLADRAQAAGLDVTFTKELLGNFVVPKPLPRTKGGK